jgi:hypothetical protein
LAGAEFSTTPVLSYTGRSARKCRVEWAMLPMVERF